MIARIGLALLGSTLAMIVAADDPKQADLAKKPQWQRMLTGKDAKTADALIALIAEKSKQDDYSSAVKAAEELLALRIARQGADHFEAATIREDVTALRKLASSAPDVRRKWRGSFDRTDQAMEHYKRAEYEKFVEILREILEVRRSVLGDNHPDIALEYNNIALNVSADEGESLLRKALQINMKALGEHHPDTARILDSLAVNLGHQGRSVESGTFQNRALNVYREVHGDDHEQTLTSLNNYAMGIKKLGRHDEAQVLLERVLTGLKARFGERHALVASSYFNVAGNLRAQGRYADAEPLYSKCIAIREDLFGKDHPVTAASYNHAAINWNAMGQYDKGRILHEKALVIRRSRLGETHPQTSQSLQNVAFHRLIDGRRAEAIDMLRISAANRTRILGDGHSDTGIGHYNLAIALLADGKVEDAERAPIAAAFAHHASRLLGAEGFDRATLDPDDPRKLLAAIKSIRAPRQAWFDFERTLARGFLDHQNSSIRQYELEAGDEAKQARTRIASLEPRIQKLVTKSNSTAEERFALESLVRERRQAMDRLVGLATRENDRLVADGDTIQNAIAADSAIFFCLDVASEFVNLHEHWACVVRSTGEPKWERLPGTGPGGKWTKDDSALPGRLRAALAGNASAAEVATLAKQLHAQRIAPVLKHLDGVKTLHCVPVHEMAGVPVESLTNDFTIGYIPSGTYLARAKEKPKSTGNRLLSVGDPIFETGETRTASVAKPLPPGGLLVTQVVPESIAAKAKLVAGDVLLKYGDTELTDLDSLKKAIAANEKAKDIPVTIWRESAEKPIVREVDPGRLGIVLDPEPAPTAVAARRRFDDQYAKQTRGGEWIDLPGTRVETNRLRQLFGDSAKVVTDSAASEQTLESLRKSGELAKYRYFHFATHGEGNSVRAFESALILSQDNLPKDSLPKPGEPWINGQLAAREVLDYWKLDAELVTLSACETAIGKSGGGDGLLGFAQAFLTAGARSVCLSLWKVDDSATALLMGRFYENLLGKREGLAKPMGKAAALDEAKRWLRNLSADEALTLTAKISNGVARGTRGKDVKLIVKISEKEPANDAKPFAHPKYWAAFILIGDPN